MTVAAKELKAQIAKVERQIELTEQAGLELLGEYQGKINALLVEIVDQKVRAREMKIFPVLEAAVRAGKLYPSERATFEAHLMAVPFEKFDSEVERVRLSFEEKPQVIELGVEYGPVEKFDAPGSGEDPQTREELEDELSRSFGPQTKVIDSSGIRESIAEGRAQEFEEVK